MDAANEARELLRAVRKALPNIDSYLREVLRREKLSPEAEALRARYEVMLGSLEKATTTVRHSIAVDPVGLASRRGMLNRSKTEGEFLISHHHLVTPEQPATIPELSGPLLCRDENLRWHRRFCRLIPTEMSLYIHEGDDSMKVLDIISLRKTTSTFAPDDIDKDHCFVIELIQSRSSAFEVDENFSRFFFAAYTETEFMRWKSTVSRVQGLSHALSSSSIGQDSMFSSGSGERESVLFGESDRNSFPLPNIPTEGDQDDDNRSDCTIYEDIDELVQQFDLTMKATMDQVQQINPSSKKSKKTKGKKDKEGNIVGKLKDEQRAQLQQGHEHNGFMYKRTGTGSWKKRWCVLRGCFFTFMKSPGSSQIHEYVLLRAEVQMVKDAKKQFVFRLACKGVPEIFLACDDEDDFKEWFSMLSAASKRGDDLNGLMDDKAPEKAQPLPEGIYNVPRSTMDFALQYPSSPLSEGIYDVPRSLAGSRDMLNTAGNEGTRSPFDLYDVPRSVLVPSPEEDAIYDDPLDLDLGDMEIYDYPPDVSELGLVEEESAPGAVPSDTPNRNSGSVISNEYDSSHSQTPASGESTVSSGGSGSNRQSMIGSFGSMEDIPTIGPIQDGFRSLPISTGRNMDSFLAGISSIPSVPPPVPNGPLPNSMNFSQYQIRGILHRKERFHIWSRCFCLIRNSFLECHKSSSSFNSGAKPLLKLFLLGSSVADAPDAKKPFSFQIKHPRREGTLVFAADSENEYKRWMDAFVSATHISVQQVDTVDEMRINNSDLKKKWTTLEKDMNENENKPSPSHGRFVRWKTSSSSGSGADDNRTNSLKRRALTSMSFHRKSAAQLSMGKEILTVSNEALSPSAVDGDVDSLGYDGVKRSASLDPIAVGDPGSTDDSQIQSYAHRTMSPVGVQSFRGYLKVMAKKEDKWTRLWCVLEDRNIICFVSQMKPTIVHQLSLHSSTIVRADEECKRKYSFRVWNSDTRQRFFFSAYDEDEFASWFAEVTQGASFQGSSQPSGKGDRNSGLYYFSKEAAPPSLSGSFLVRNLTGGSLTSADDQLSEGGDSVSLLSTGDTEHLVSHHGPLKKRNEKHHWNDRYCRIKNGKLFVYYNASDETPIAMLPLAGSTIERVNLPHTELERFTFNLNTSTGKTLLLAAPSDQDLLAWLRAIQQCQAPRGATAAAATASSALQPEKRSRGSTWSFKSRPEMLAPKTSKSLKRLGHSASGITSRKLPSTQLETVLPAEQDTVIHIPALTMADDATISGFMDVQFDGVGPWLKHWCALYQNCLHIYLNKEASSSIRSITLQGCLVKSFAASAKKNYSFSLTMPGDKPVHLAAMDHVDLHRWFLAVDSASRVGDGPRPTGADDDYVSLVAGNVERPKEQKEEIAGDEETEQAPPTASFEEKDVKKPLSEEDFKEKQMAVIAHYEKKIRKTQKVSKMTHESLIKQMETMRLLQQKFTEHSQKLQKNPKSSDAAGQRRLKEMQVKSHQITKVLPYLEKYVQVNHQAETQTLAILREGCAVDLQELENKYRSKAPVTPSIPRKTKKERVKSASSLLDSAEKFNSLSRVKKSKRKSHSSSRKSLDLAAKEEQPSERSNGQSVAQQPGEKDATLPGDSATVALPAATTATLPVAMATLPVAVTTSPPVLPTEPQVPPLLTEPEVPPLLTEPEVPPLLTEPEIPLLSREPMPPHSPSLLSSSHSTSSQSLQPRGSPVPSVSSLPPLSSHSSSPLPHTPPPGAFMTTPLSAAPGEFSQPLSVPNLPAPVTPPYVTPPLTPPPGPPALAVAPPPPPPPPSAPLTAPPPPPPPPSAPLTAPPPPPMASVMAQPSSYHAAPPSPALDEEEQYDPVIVTRSPPATKPKPKRGNSVDRHSLQYAELSVVHTNAPPLPASETMVDYAVVDLSRRRSNTKQATSSSLPQNSPLHRNGSSSEQSTLSSLHQHAKVSPLHQHHLNRSSYAGSTVGPSNSRTSGPSTNGRNSFDPKDNHNRNSMAIRELSSLTKAAPSLAERMKAFQ